MKIIVIGCGRVGAGLAANLTLLGHALTVVDHDPKAFARLGPHFRGRTLTGVGFDRAVLLEAGVESADGLAAVTGSDEANVVVARTARLRFHVPRVVARLYDPRKADIYRRLGLTTVSPVRWGIQRLSESLVLAQLEVVFSVGSGEVELVVVVAPPGMAGRVVGDLNVPGEIQVTALRRQGRTFLPAPGTPIEAGDVAYLAVTPTAAPRLNDMFGLA